MIGASNDESLAASPPCWLRRTAGGLLEVELALVIVVS